MSQEASIRLYGTLLLAYVVIGLAFYLFLAALESFLNKYQQLLAVIRTRISNEQPVPPFLPRNEDLVNRRLGQVERALLVVPMYKGMVSFGTVTLGMILALSVVVLGVFSVLYAVREKQTAALLSDAVVAGDEFACISAAPSSVPVSSSIIIRVDVWRLYDRLNGKNGCYGAKLVAGLGRSRRFLCGQYDANVAYSVSAPAFAISKDYVTDRDSCETEHEWIATANVAGDQVLQIALVARRKHLWSMYRSIRLSESVTQSQNLETLTPLLAAILSLLGAVLAATLGALLGKGAKTTDDSS